MAKKANELTPMMQQFYTLKEQNPGALLLFRCGDFYETYCEDAEKASQLLGITLTRRSNGSGKGDAMAGFPYHALDTYLPRLVRSGCRVAICDQLEDPKKTKKLVKRGITEVVTPGVAMQDNVLNQKENNFLCAVAFGRGTLGVALLDISTGEFMCGEGTYQYAAKVIENFQPKEIIYDRTRDEEFRQHFPTRIATYALDDWAFAPQNAEQKLKRHFGVATMKGFGIDHLHNGITAAGAIMQYLQITRHDNVGHITALKAIDTERYVRIDHFTLRSLEILAPMTAEGTSLLSVIDRTQTAMGGRLMKRWLTFPLKDRKKIGGRANIVEYLTRNTVFRDNILGQLQRIADLERLASKISTSRIMPREMLQLMNALNAIAELKTTCRQTDFADLMLTASTLDPCTDLAQDLMMHAGRFSSSGRE